MDRPDAESGFGEASLLALHLLAVPLLLVFSANRTDGCERHRPACCLVATRWYSAARCPPFVLPAPCDVRGGRYSLTPERSGESAAHPPVSTARKGGSTVEELSRFTGITFPIRLSSDASAIDRRIAEWISWQLSGHRVELSIPSSNSPPRFEVSVALPPPEAAIIKSRLVDAFGPSITFHNPADRLDLDSSTPAWAGRWLARQLKSKYLTNNGKCDAEAIWPALINLLETLDETRVNLRSERTVVTRSPEGALESTYKVSSHWRVVSVQDAAFLGTVISEQVLLRLHHYHSANSVSVVVESTVKLRKRDSRREFFLEKDAFNLQVGTATSTGDFDEQHYGKAITELLLRPPPKARSTQR